MIASSRREIIFCLAMLGAAPKVIRGESESNRQSLYDDGEAYRVYSALIPQDWISISAKAEFLVIASLTVSSEMCLEPDSKSARLLAPAIANYKKLATKQWRLRREFRLSTPYTLVEQQDLDGYFRKDGSGWDGFYKRYPKSGGYLFLSPVGFNSAKDIAVVQVNHSCGGLCGAGTFSVLRKEGGEWKSMDWRGSFCAWAS